MDAVSGSNAKPPERTCGIKKSQMRLFLCPCRKAAEYLPAGAVIQILFG